jgi:hypothetical protein
LGHRTSIDFDFFSNNPFDPEKLYRQIPYLAAATVTQMDKDTLTCLVDREGMVKVSFFGDLGLGRIYEPEQADNGMRIASLADIAATKALAIQKRAVSKDYIDIDALMEQAGFSILDIIRYAKQVYGSLFNPLLTLKALGFYGETELDLVPKSVRLRLTKAALQAQEQDII